MAKTPGSNARTPTMLVALALSVPLVGAHFPEGIPKNYCEDFSEWATHDYAPPSSGLLMGLGQDGNLAGDCNGDGVPADYDGHQEWAIGGAWLLVDSGDGVTTGSLACLGEPGHHDAFGLVTVEDAILGGAMPFTVSADFISLLPPTGGMDCGDFESDESVTCSGSCVLTFPPGLDGAYQVYVGDLVAVAFSIGGHVTSGPGQTIVPACSDGIDNDGDGWTDYPADPGCYRPEDASEVDPLCVDGIDNDGDGWTDYPDDPGCSSTFDNAEDPNPACSDGLDNDGDGSTDYPADNGCTSLRDNEEKLYQCQDGLDNDGDGAVDYPSDFGCFSPYDDSEAPNPACSNGVDDDGDGSADYPNDPGCAGSRDGSEADGTPAPECGDGLDNDGDFWIDYPEDPGCASAADTSEADSAPRPACSDGFDNDGDLKIDWPVDPDCDSPVDDNEHPGPDSTACSDGLDNDGDGLPDYPADPQCASIGDDDESS